MLVPEATCWTMIRDAAGGDPAARERFARVYLPVVKAYLAARWRSNRRDRADAGDQTPTANVSRPYLVPRFNPQPATRPSATGVAAGCCYQDVVSVTPR